MPNTTRPRTLAGAIHPHCVCFKCRVGHATWIRERRAAVKAGTWQPWTDPAPVLAHVEKLHQDGMPYSLIARLAGVGELQIRRMRGTAGRACAKIRTETAQALMAVQLRYSHLPPKSAVPARATCRRIQALRAVGWPSYAIARLAGLSESPVAEALVSPRVRIETHRLIVALYEILHDQDPAEYGVDPVMIRRGRRYARRRGWAPPTGWDDIDLDEAPKSRIEWSIRYAKAEGSRADVVIEQTAELAKFGEPRERIAERVGISWDAIARAHMRAGVDLPEIAEVAA